MDQIPRRKEYLQTRSHTEFSFSQISKKNEEQLKVLKNVYKRSEDKLKKHLQKLEYSMKTHFFGLREIEACLQRIAQEETHDDNMLLSLDDSPERGQARTDQERVPGRPACVDKDAIFQEISKIQKRRETHLKAAEVSVNSIQKIKENKIKFEKYKHKMPYLGVNLKSLNMFIAKRQKDNQMKLSTHSSKIISSVEKSYQEMLLGAEGKKLAGLYSRIGQGANEDLFNEQDKDYLRLSRFLSDNEYRFNSTFDSIDQKEENFTINQPEDKPESHSIFGKPAKEENKLIDQILEDQREPISAQEFDFVIDQRNQRLMDSKRRMPRVRFLKFYNLLEKNTAPYPMIVLLRQQKDPSSKGASEGQKSVCMIHMKSFVVLNIFFKNEALVKEEEPRSQDIVTVIMRVQFNFLWDQSRVWGYEDLEKMRLLRKCNQKKKEELKKYYQRNGTFSLFCDSTSSMVMENLTEAICHSVRSQVNYQDTGGNHILLMKSIWDYIRLLNFQVSPFKNSLKLKKSLRKVFVCEYCSSYRKVFWCEEKDKKIVQFPFWLLNKKKNCYYHLVCIQRLKKKKMKEEIDNYVLVKRTILREQFPESLELFESI